MNPFGMLSRYFKMVWIGCAVVGLSLVGVCVWGVIKLITHIVGS